MSNILWERSLRVAASAPMSAWVQNQANLGLAPRIIDAYSRAIEDSLAFSRRRVISREAASREHLACYVHDLTERPKLHGCYKRFHSARRSVLPLRMGLPQWRNEARNSPMCQLLLDPHRIYWEQVKKGGSGRDRLPYSSTTCSMACQDRAGGIESGRGVLDLDLTRHTL